MADKNMTLVEHLNDLRRVVIVSVIAVMVSSIVSYAVLQDRLFAFMTAPVGELGLPLVTIGVTEAFFTKLKLTLITGVILSSPVIAWEFWGFVAPALQVHERRYVYVLVPASVILFVTGVAFAYFTVFRFAARFLLVTAGQGLTVMVSVSKYVSFLLSFLLPFGAVFEMPLVVWFLTYLGIINPAFLVRYRRIAILAIFVTAAVLTPGPDLISQLLMGVPMIALYEVSILISRLVKRKKGEGVA